MISGGYPVLGRINPLDMPDDFFRIRLVATILDTCGIFFNRGAAGKKLDYFLSFLQVSNLQHCENYKTDSFQYYIYTKEVLPMDIEFIVQDVFALTRPQWKLASNIEEAGRAFQLALAQDQKTSGMVVADIESDSSSEDGIDDGEAEAEADTVLAEAEAEADEDSDSDEEADVSPITPTAVEFKLTSTKLDANPPTHNTDSEEETIVVTREEEEVDPEDEADFEREYAKMMAESLDSRKHERKSTFDVPLPMKRKDRDINSSNDAWAEDSSSNAAPSGTMAFSLLTKRGNRQQVSLVIPSQVNSLLICSTRLAL